MGVIIGLVMSCAGIFYKPVSTDLGVSVGDFGLYMTFIYVFSFLMLSIAGKMLDKYSARWLLSLCSAIVGVLFLTSGLIFLVTAGIIGFYALKRSNKSLDNVGS